MIIAELPGTDAWIGPVVGGVTSLGTGALLSLLATRVRLGVRGRFTALDAAMALATLLWLSGWAGLLIHRVTAGHWLPADAAEVSLSQAALGTAIGGIAAAVFAWARAGSDGLGLRRTSWRWLGAALLCLPVFLVFSAAWITALEALGVAEVEQEVLTRLRDGPRDAGALGVLVYGALVAPVVEELIFRGFVQPTLTRRLGGAVGIGLTALLFGGLHATDPAAVVPLTGLGAGLGWLRWRSDSVWPAIALHLGNNAVALAAALWVPTVI